MSDDLHELAAPFALDSLDDLERARFVRHLDQCEECQGTVAEFRETLVSIAAMTREAPPPGLKKQLLEAVAATPQVVDRTARRRMPWSAVAVAALVAVLALIGWSILSPGRLINAVLGDPAALTTLAAPTDNGVGVFDQVRLVYSEKLDAAILVFEGLDRPGEGQTYEIWLIDGTDPVPAGLFRPDDSGSATVRVKGDIRPGLTVAVTAEPEGGADLPTGPPLLTADIGA